MKLIKTPWGEISPEVNLFPIYYIFFIYGFVYIFPYGKNIIGITWFDLLKLEDGPLEWLQFSEYFISSIFGIYIYFKSKNKKTINSFIWLILSAFCFFVAAEEISWGERITGFSLNSLTEISIQSETNLKFSKNIPFIKRIRNHRLKDIFENITFKPIFILIIRTFPILPFSLGSYFIASSEINKRLIIVYSLFGAYFYYFSLFFIIQSA